MTKPDGNKKDLLDSVIPRGLTEKPLLIYVAGPLNGDACSYLQNVATMCRHSIAISTLGHYPYNPSLDFLEGVVAGVWEYENYFRRNQPWLERSDALYRIAPSPGTDKEVAHAIELGLHIFYSLDDVPMTTEACNRTGDALLAADKGGVDDGR